MQKLININIDASRWFDKRLLPPSYSVDGNKDFLNNVISKYVVQGMKVYDVGGGKRPVFTKQIKQQMNLEVVGIDISRKELEMAPEGSYDSTWCEDISNIEGNNDGDLVVCQSLLEHVRNTEEAISAIATLIKPGGKAMVFVPNRNAVYARLNLLLPQKIKQSVLYTVFPSKRLTQGFPSFYHRCTPDDFIGIGKENGMKLIEARYYFMSSYFSFFFPLYILWRLWTVVFKYVAGRQASETFTMIFEKNNKMEEAVEKRVIDGCY